MKTKISNRKGFTLIELLIVLQMIAIIVVVFGFGLIGAVLMGNEWFTVDGVLRELRASDPKVQEIVSIERRIIRKSIITVRLNDKTTKLYWLDSNILQNYTFTPKEK